MGDKMPVQRSMQDFFRDSSGTSPSRVLVLISLVCGCCHSSVKSSAWHPGLMHHHPPAGEGTDTRTLSVESWRDVMGGGKCEQVQSGCC